MSTRSELTRSLRETRPADHAHLWNWTYGFTGLKVARNHVCRGHAAPFDFVATQLLERPSAIAALGPRGGGKSFLAALCVHIESRFQPLSTCVLGGAKSQSRQIYDGLKRLVLDGRGPAGSERDTVARLLESKGEYRNGSDVSILACSPTSVRGPHVQSLKLDEVDEIDPELREDALGMATSSSIASSSVMYTSTWHKVGGPMGAIVERGRAGEFPFFEWCVFDVLEHCPESRSGPRIGGDALYAKCPECPLVRWCHAERDRNGDEALAKLSDGHYAIDALIQKTVHVSGRVFDADYLCRGPRGGGVFFPEFNRATHVSESAAYDPKLPAHLAIDSGVFTAALWIQVRRGPEPLVTVFGEFAAEGRAAEENAEVIAEHSRELLGRIPERVSTDPAGGARNAIGPTVTSIYLHAGLRGKSGLENWPSFPGSVADGLARLEALISPADGRTRLLIHPSCRRLVVALEQYARAKRGGQWQDYAQDPQHPHEDLIDTLRCALAIEFPDGLTAPIAKILRPSELIYGIR